MPTSKTISFNQWLLMQHGGPYEDLAKVWVTTRGRLTLEAVVKRAEAAGVAAERAALAWGAYLLATGTVSRAYPETPPSTL